VAHFPAAQAEIVRLLNRNRIFMSRLRGVGMLSREDAINYSCSGPVARASGVVRDLRKDEPYLAYPDFEFKVVCSDGCDSYARYLVRMQEMLESNKIIDQAIENLPGGPINVDAEGRAIMPGKQEVYQSIEGLIRHFETIIPNRGFLAPVEEIYAAQETANGELGYYIVGDGTIKAYRARTRPPSYIHFAVFPHLIKGHTLSDVVAVLGSLNIIAAELDR
jgi:NADH-quinone oxidoreductase subunit D